MHTIACHQCGEGFEAVRPHAKFCAPACRKTSSRRNNPEPPMNRISSPSKRHREDEVFDLHDVLCGTYYGMHPHARSRYLETLIDRAIEGDAKAKAVLTCPVLVRSHTGKGGNLQKQYHFRRCFAYPTIPFEAHRFTMETWGVSLFDALALPLTHPLATPPVAPFAASVDATG